MESDRDHRFGGDWTEDKLKVLRLYLQTYAKALKNEQFEKYYIDAFAGTGYREAVRETKDPQYPDFIEELAEDEPKALLDGSARIALEVDPSFDKFFFIEKNSARCQKLERLKLDFPEKTDRINILQGDSNTILRDFCSKQQWGGKRAVLFLDPYGMQVEWKTLQAIAKTKAIDLWILFPVGQAVTRLLPRDGNVPPEWEKRLTIFFGTAEWREELYQVSEVEDLFGPQVIVEKQPIDAIGRYFVKRLKEEFAAVAEMPRTLHNRTGRPLFLLCFAVSNARAVHVAMPIANHILGMNDVH